MQIKKKDVLELDIIDYSFGGKGIAKISLNGVNKFVVFVENAYPGEKVKAELKKIKKNYAEASLVEIIKPSEYRTEAICEHFGVCGGCKALDLKYDYQLFYKDKQIKESFEKIGTLNLNDIRFYDILGCEQNLYYRNKVEFSFAPKRWLTHKEVESGKEFNDRFFALGFHVPNNYDKVININQCHIVDKVASEILVVTRNFFSERNVTIYDNASNSGLLRNLVVRKSFLNHNFMVILITSSYEKDLMNDYKNMLISKFNQISTIVVGVNSKKSMVAVGDEYYTLYGDGYLVESIGKFKYKISPKSFFQTNTIQAKKLYDKIIELAEFEKNDIAYDLFCGAGTITNYVSEYVSKVYGFEVVEQSILDAKENALSNNVTNVEFIHFDLNKSLLPVIQSNSIPRPDVIILDPPRSGLHPNTIKDILNILPKKIVYVSCNPTTQARDLKELKPFYNVIKSQAVDMFPHTYHLENITILKLKES